MFKNTKKQTILLTSFGVVAIAAVFILVAMATILHNRGALGPDAVALLFFNEWSEQALTSPTKPIDNNLHERSTYVTESFGRTAGGIAEKGRAPVLCEATPPNGVDTEVVTEDETTAAVVVREESGNQLARAYLTRDDLGLCSIDEIDCS